MKRFAAIAAAVGATASKKEKVRLLAGYLASLDAPDAARAALWFCGRPFPRFEERVLNAGGSLLWQALDRITGAGNAGELYRRHGDLGDMAAEVLAGYRPAAELTLAGTEAFLERIAAARGPGNKIAVIEALLRLADAEVARYLIKIITGDLRIGLKESLVEEAIAEAFARPPEDVRRANMLTGDIAATTQLAREDRLRAASLTLLRPVGCMLASPVESAAEAFTAPGATLLVEDKFDGIRAQAHKSGSTVRLYSRTLDEIVEFHELPGAFATLEGDFVLDGEIVGWRDGRPLPFTTLQQRLGRKQPDLFLHLEIPVCFVAFDLLFAGGESLLDAPLVERLDRLRALIPANGRVRMSEATNVDSEEALTEAFQAALARGNEGVMIKDARSAYTPGRRGRAWLKWKQPLATLDAVVVAVEFGHGKRRGLLSDYTFAVRDGDRLVTIGKAYSGLTDAEIRDYTAYFIEHTIAEEGHRRTVIPEVVLEVAFNNVQRSSRHDSGFALRFPRIVRIREDKRAADIDTVERVRQIFDSQAMPNE